MKLYEKYLSLHPINMKTTDFYLRPLANPKPNCLRVGPNSQITVHVENSLKYLLYKEDISKTRQGGLKQKNPAEAGACL